MTDKLKKALKSSEANVVALTSQLKIANEALKRKDADLTQLQMQVGESQTSTDRKQQGLELSIEELKQKEFDISRREDLLLLDRQDLEMKNKLVVEKSAEVAASALDLSKQLATLAKAQEQSFNHAKELERSNIELREVNAKLNQLLQQRDDFVASITHDLKNPLIGSNKIVEAIISGSVPADEQQFLLEQILSSNKHMLHMIWNLLDTYKHHSGALVPHLVPTNLVALLHDILSEFSFQMKLKNQSAKLDIQASFPDVQLDRILIRRAIFNLISNAIKFTPEGGYIQVLCSFNSTEVKLTVQDSGKGIPFEMRERLFQQFWQGCRGKENDIGTGLGLYLTKNIIELHGGTLECASTEGTGAEFTITLKRNVSSTLQ